MKKRNKEERTLTKAEMEIMSVLWDEGKPLTTHDIIAHYPDPKPAYSTIATFLKILTKKEFIASQKQEGGGKTFLFIPLLTRDEYTARMMKEVKSTFFGNSLKSLLSFFVEQEELTAEEIEELKCLMKKAEERSRK